jgi:hypothetical protein
MRVLAAVAVVLALLCPLVLADDSDLPVPPASSPPAAAPQTLTAAEWTKRAEAATALPTTLARVQALRKLASEVVILCRGKIHDLRPSGSRIEVDVCRIGGGPVVRTFTIREDERPAIAEWQKWDRIEWRIRAVVDDDATIRYQALVNAVGDLTRTPNPGVEFEPLAKRRGTASEFARWIERFGNAAFYSRGVEEVWQDGCNSTWVFPGAIESVGEQLVIRIDGEPRTKLYRNVPVRANGMIIYRPEYVRTIGLLHETYTLAGFDEQLRELAPGTKVDIAVELRADGAAVSAHGEFSVSMWVCGAKLPKKAKTKK